MHNTIVIFIHLMAAAIAVGGLVVGLLLLLPALEKRPAPNAPEEHTAAYITLEVLMPTVFACMLALVGSGVYYLFSNYTSQYGLDGGYFNLFGIKMVFVAGAFFLSAYQTFGLRSRITNLDLSPENRTQVPATIKKLRSLSRITLALISIALFLGIWLARF